MSRWSSPLTASQFAGIYAHSLKDRYKKASESSASVTQVASEENKHEDAPASLSGRHAWDTDEGVVVIEQQGDTVLVSESLDAATTATLEKEVFGK